MPKACAGIVTIEYIIEQDASRPEFRKHLLERRRNYRRKKYWEDEEFREKEKAKGRKRALEWFRKKSAEDSGWNARRQRELRKKYPITFNKVMARWYIRRLSVEKIVEVLKEAGVYNKIIKKQQRCRK